MVEPPRKKIKRQLTLKLNTCFIHKIENTSRPKNEYVHIETLYNYSKPVWEYHRPCIIIKIDKNNKTLTNTNENGFYLDEIENDDDDDDDDEEEDNEEEEEEEEEDKPSLLRTSFINNTEL
eukprot:493855_1